MTVDERRKNSHIRDRNETLLGLAFVVIMAAFCCAVVYGAGPRVFLLAAVMVGGLAIFYRRIPR